MKGRWTEVALRIVLFALVGCGGPESSTTPMTLTDTDSDPPDPDTDTDTASIPGTPDFQVDIVPALYRSCGAGDNTCHSRIAYGPQAPVCLGWLALEDVPLGAVNPTTGDPTGCPDLDLYARLLEKAAWSCYVDGSTMVYVVPGDLDQSYLWQKVLPEGLHCYGSDVMPFDRPLDPDDRAILEDWILAGAPR